MAAARSHHNRGACCIPRRRLACPPVGPPGRLAAAQIGLERSPGEVTAASVEEDRGVEQISKAISQMDHCLHAKNGQRPSPADCGRAFDGRIVPTGACPAAPQSFQFIPSAYPAMLDATRPPVESEASWQSVATARPPPPGSKWAAGPLAVIDRKSTRLNSSHLVISYAVFCLKKKTTTDT